MSVEVGLIHDVAVIGAGPAGLAIAAACAGEGCDVVVIDEAHDAPWVPNYAVWADEVHDPELSSCHDGQWSVAHVFLGSEHRALPRTYARVHGPRMKEALAGRVRAGRGRFVPQRVTAVSHDDDATRVTLADGATVSARVLIDASGARSPFTAREPQGAATFQTAYGLVARLSSWPTHDLWWMDFRDDHLRPDERALPTFLYALPWSDGRVLVEETALVRQPAVSLDLLQDRLARRLAHMGVRVESVESVERCVIPLDVPLPRRAQRTVAYGAAAAMVHPATGYQVAAALARAPGLARVIAATLHEGPAATSRAAWSHLWPASRVRARRLMSFAAASLATLDGESTRGFFRGFFALPPEEWQAFLSDALSVGEIASVMTSLFRETNAGVRGSLVAGGLSAGLMPLARAVMGA